MPLTSGTRLGTYEIVAPLGAGGMGEVYRAKDLRLGREVALKVLPADVATHPERLARFEREARTVAGLNHPNIVVLYAVEDEDGVRFLTMELVEGASLRMHIKAGGLPLETVLDLGIPLSEALVAAHEKGVVHRDLKPANVLLTREGRVKVLDFGLAKLEAVNLGLEATRAETIDAPLSVEGLVVGTVPYMAPEQIRGEVVDARADLFALGIILYELATGRRPFTGPTQAEMIASILRDTPKPLRSVRADLPGDLERIVGRCLEKNPRERVQTALDVCSELHRVRHVVEVGERGTSRKSEFHAVASIAVLPFVNRSREEEDEYFSDGLADELLNVLAKIRGLRVAARSSSFQFKGTKDDLATIGQKLNVATLLEGSVRKAGNRVRISVQLVKVSDGYHLWSETYDRTLDDIFAVQDDIAQSVVRELRTALLGEEVDSKAGGERKSEVAKAAKGRGQNSEAHRLYLQAGHFIERFTREDMDRGIGYLKDALELDPAFPLAWAELAGAYSHEADRGWVPVAEGWARAREAGVRALALEPDLAEGHAALAWIQTLYEWDWNGAEVLFRRALELAPGNASALRGIARLALNHGDCEKAIGLYRRAIEQDPLSSNTYHSLGFASFRAGRLAEAEEAFRKALELAPQRAVSHARLAHVLHGQRRGQEALAEARQELNEPLRLCALAIIRHGEGRGAEVDEILRELIEKHAEDAVYPIAEVLGTRGETDAAFEWLERAYARRDAGLTDMKSNSRFRSLHGDPRWGAFLNKMGFEDGATAESVPDVV